MDDGEDPAVSYYDLGSFTREVSTKNPEAQRWVDRGLVWNYGFNHEESAKCFEKAITLDPNCAFAYWGLAYVLGPNYNKPWEYFDPEELQLTLKRTYRAVEQAKERIDVAAPVERALIHALQFRYPQERPGDELDIWNAQYADAMATVHQKYPDDLDVAALYADALMNLTPWKLWDISTGQPAPGARTMIAKSVLDGALALPGGSSHPGLLHLYIHLMEMSATPENALNVADKLRGLVPDSGHLNHMPTHLDILCGDYRRAIASNTDAIKADEKYVGRSGAINFYTLYRAHDYHFRLYAAMFAGQSAVALETATWLENSIPEALLRIESPPMADWLEGALGMRIHVLVRFGRWKEITNLQVPKDEGLYCVSTALIHYAKGIAFAVQGEIEQAKEQKGMFEQAVTRVPSSRMIFNNKCVDILAIAAKMLEGELEYRRANYDEAFQRLREAIALDDNLPYDEPWGWMQPARHAYGALLLEQGHVEEAAAVYKADLGFDDTLPRPLRHPNNVWALHGYHEALTRLDHKAEAAILKPQLAFALATADVVIKSSCFCRKDTYRSAVEEPRHCGVS